MNTKAITKIQTVILVLIVAIAIVGGSVYYFLFMGPSAVTEQTLVIATTESSVDTLDPVKGWSKTTYYLSSLVFESLLQAKPPNCTEFVGKLAKSWTMSSDAKTWELTLREGVKFHDGTPFNATVAKMCLLRVRDLGVANSVYFKDIDDIQVINDYKMRIILKSANVFFESNLAMTLGGPMYPVETALALGNNTWAISVLYGSGPYKFSEYVKNERAVLVRNEEYWGQKPKLKKIIIRYIPDPTTARMALEAGEIDMFTDFAAASDIPIMIANPDIEHKTVPAGRHRHLYFSQFTGAPMNNTLVRQAIAYAINRTRVWKVGYKGFGLLTESLLQNWLTPYYKPSFERYVYNTTKAKELLTQAGYPNGFSTDLYYTSYWDIRDVDVAQVMAEDLAAVGIQVTTHFLETAAFWEKEYTAEGNITVSTMPLDIDGWAGDNTNPEMAMMLYLHPDYGMDFTVLYWYTNGSQRFAELGYLGRANTNIAERVAIYNEAQDILADEMVTLPLTVDNVWVWYRPWVKDFSLYPNKMMMDIQLQNVYIAAHD